MDKNSVCGFINLYKEQDFTSNDAVNIVRGIFGRIKTGHTGTLDPMATGVLPICLGKATKLADVVQAERKVYRTEMILGIETDTYDIWGKTLSEREVTSGREDIKAAITSFIGETEQLPPMYSAIKIQGKRLYELAREGKTAERKTRRITIFDIFDIDFGEKNKVSFTVCCSKGTYIRSLCHDIGEKLGCGAAMSALERVSTGGFEKISSVTLSELKAMKEEGKLLDAVIPPEGVLKGYKHLQVSSGADKFIENGNKISLSFFVGEKPETEESFLLFDSKQRLIGIYKEETGFSKPLIRLI